ncbi:MAG TPA: TRAP transporter small permease [Casimicrobiaceae bacterium]
MTRFRAAYGQLLEWVVVALMLVLAVEVTLGVVFRFSGHSLIWYDEVASVLLAWLTFYGSALASVKRAHIGCPELVDRMPWPARRAVNIGAQLLVIAFFALLGGVGVWITPILATDTLVSLPWIPMSVVQSVIPITALLIIIAELTHLVDLISAKKPPPRAGQVSLAEGTQ